MSLTARLHSYLSPIPLIYRFLLGCCLVFAAPLPAQQTLSDYFASSDTYGVRELSVQLQAADDELLGRVVDSLSAAAPSAALELLEQASPDAAAAPLVYLFRGMAHLDLLNLDEARINVDSALQLEPTLMMGYQTLVTYHLQREDRDAAIATCHRAAAAVPGAPEPNFILGVLEYTDGAPVRARLAWEESVRLDGCYVPARIAILMQRIGAGRLNKGAKEVVELLDCDELNPDVYHLLSIIEDYKGHPELAIRHVTSALSLDRENPRYLFYRSDLYRKEKRYPEALNDLYYAYAARASWRTGPDLDAQELTNRTKEMEYAINYYRFQGSFDRNKHAAYARYLLALELRDAEELRRAEKELRNAGEDGHPGFEYFRILAEARRGYGTVIDSARIAGVLRNDPRITDLYRLQGQQQLQHEHYAAAFASFRSMAKLEPSSVAAHKGMANALLEIGRRTAARHLLAKVLELDSTDIYALGNLGDLYFQQGDYLRALPYYQRVVERRPHYDVVRYHAAFCAHRTGNYGEALEQLNGIPEQNFTYDARYPNLRGLTYLALDSTEQAWHDFNAAIKLDPHFYEAYANRARVSILRERFDTALRELNYVLTQDPEQGIGYFLRALVRRELGQEGACQDLASARRLGVQTEEREEDWCGGADTVSAGDR